MSPMRLSPRFLPPRRDMAWLSVLGIVLFGTLLADPVSGTESAPPRGPILRYNPIIDVMVPVAENDLKPGCVYSHYSERLNRRVWAIWQADGTEVVR